MRAELVRLRAAFPEFSFNICPGWRGLTFEAWRDPGAGGVYAVITRNAAELWRELEKSRDELRPASDTCKKETPMKIRKLILNGTPDDGARLDDFCERLAATKFAAGARLRELAVELVGG